LHPPYHLKSQQTYMQHSTEKVCRKKVGNIAKKKTVEGVRFCSFGTQYFCQKYTPTDRFFGDFAHWEESDMTHLGCLKLCYQYELLLITYKRYRFLF